MSTMYFFTGQDPRHLLTLYREAFSRMKEGGFILRSWVSNCAELKFQFEIDYSGASHSMDHERVLGYKYLPESDNLSVAETFTKSNNSSVTKRSI